MSNEMAWLLHGILLGMMLASVIRLVADAVTVNHAAAAAHTAANRALKQARGDQFMNGFRLYRLTQRREERA